MSRRRKRGPAPPAPDEVNHFLANVFQHGDAGAALISAAFLDHALEELIETRLDVVAGGDTLARFSQNFGAKIALAAAVRLLDESSARDLNTVREIRNLFAHSLTRLRFTDSAVEALCRKLGKRQMRVGSHLSDAPSEHYGRAVIELYTAIRARTLEVHAKIHAA